MEYEKHRNAQVDSNGNNTKFAAKKRKRRRRTTLTPEAISRLSNRGPDLDSRTAGTSFIW